MQQQGAVRQPPWLPNASPACHLCSKPYNACVATHALPYAYCNIPGVRQRTETCLQPAMPRALGVLLGTSLPPPPVDAASDGPVALTDPNLATGVEAEALKRVFDVSPGCSCSGSSA